MAERIEIVIDGAGAARGAQVTPSPKMARTRGLETMRKRGYDLYPTGTSATDAIRRNCVNCQGGDTSAIEGCRVDDCALWPYRMGANPFSPYPKPRCWQRHEMPEELFMYEGNEPACGRRDVLTWVPVFKAGYTSIRRRLFRLGWSRESDLTTGGVRYFGMIRHPIDRWISGTAWIFSFEHRTEYAELIKQGDISWFVEQRWHDHHNAPQSWFYRNCGHRAEGSRLFRFPEFDELHGWLSEQGIQIEPFPHRNRSDGRHKELAGHLRAALEADSGLMNQLCEYFADDFELFESRRFIPEVIGRAYAAQARNHNEAVNS